MNDVTIDLGPQYSGDDRLTARMRFHQSWWRARRLNVPAGTDASGNTYGNLLTPAYGDAGLNFLTPAIHHTVRERILSGPGVEPTRCTRNLLSSQPMAFNMFGPLRADPTLAALLLDPLLPGGVLAASVHFEYAPPRRDHLTDATSCDVAVRYTTRDGKPAFAGVECKLTEPFSQAVYGADPADKRTATYRAVARRSTVWNDPEDPRLADRKWNQLWRNHLLVESIRQREPGLLGSQVVVHHPLDERCTSVIDGYGSFLADQEGTFRALDLGHIVTTWRRLVRRPAERSWLRDFEDRYLNLALSETDWANRQV